MSIGHHLHLGRFHSFRTVRVQPISNKNLVRVLKREGYMFAVIRGVCGHIWGSRSMKCIRNVVRDQSAIGNASPGTAQQPCFSRFCEGFQEILDLCRLLFLRGFPTSMFWRVISILSQHLAGHSLECSGFPIPRTSHQALHLGLVPDVCQTFPRVRKQIKQNPLLLIILSV